LAKNKKFILRFAAMLIAFAPIIPAIGSNVWVGEPQLPKQIKKKI